MSYTELQHIKKRLASLEVLVGRLSQAVGGVQRVLQDASYAPVTCDKCGNDFTCMTTCAVENCPCGLLPPESTKETGE